MPQIIRLYDFQPSTIIVSGEVDSELNQLVQTVNGKAERTEEQTFSAAQTFSAGLTATGNAAFQQGARIGRANAPSSLVDGQLWYNTTDSKLYLRQNGANKILPTGDELSSVWTHLATYTGAAHRWASATTITIPVGAAGVDGTNFISVTSALTVDLATTGANGADVAVASSAWHYIWLIKNPTTGTVAGLVSSSNSSPTLPSGFTQKALHPVPVYITSGGAGSIRPYRIIGGLVVYPRAVFPSGAGGSLSGGYVADSRAIVGTTFFSITAATLLPPNAIAARITGRVVGSGGSAYSRDPADTSETRGLLLGGVASGTTGLYSDVLVPCNAQAISLRTDLVGSTLDTIVTGFAYQ